MTKWTTVRHTYTCYMLDYKTVFISLAWLLQKLRQNNVLNVQYGHYGERAATNHCT